MSGYWIPNVRCNAIIERLPPGLQIASFPSPMPFRLFLLLFLCSPFWASGFVGGGADCSVDGVFSLAERPSSIFKELGGGETALDLFFVYDGWTKRGSAEMDIRDRVVSASAGTSRCGCPLGGRRSNLVAEFDLVASQPQLRRSYVWGQDLSGSLDGGGGVGGLLAVAEADGASYYPLFDANGNVSEYIDAAGAVAAHYLYGPFGEQLVAAGPLAENFAFRFSTKRRDAETGLLYYGMRYYEPRLGRWLSPDPAEEAGGLNLYGFLGNDGVNRWDLLGMMPGDALGDPDLSIETVLGMPSAGSALATQLGVGGILSLEDSRRKAEQYAAIGCKEEALQFMSDALRQATLEAGMLALRVVPGGYGLGKSLLRGNAAALRNSLSMARAVQARVGDVIARSSQRVKGALGDAAHKVKGPLERLRNTSVSDGALNAPAVQNALRQSAMAKGAANRGFGVGDEIADLRIQRVLQGDSGKIALMGRSMGNSKMPGVRDAYKALKKKGYVVEIFDEPALSGDMLRRFQSAAKQFEQATQGWTKRLTNSDVMKLDMYKLNKEWARKLKNDGYQVLDFGDMNNLGFSPFYSMEKMTLFK
jgi:RHS repeat-associated protein